MRKLSDAEFVERTRASNRRRSERQREKLTVSGRAALTVWLPSAIRQRLKALAAAEQQTISETATTLLITAMTPPTADPLPLFNPASTEREHERPSPVDAPSDPDAMMRAVAAMQKAEPGMKGAEMARRLTAAGFKTSNGAELKGQNVLKAYRQWREKHGLNAHGELKR